MHLYNFATALNGRYMFGNDNEATQEILDEEFNNLSLEYKMSNILQAKEFAKHLSEIGCFYTDKPVAYELLENFTEAHMDVIGPLEHKRWITEKEEMGWSFDESYDNSELVVKMGMPSSEDKKAIKKAISKLRESTRTHKLMIPDYYDLDEDEQNKDTAPMNLMLKLIEKYDGLRIYRVK